nr:hypothetical protein [Tanacetum cinerariifolium]
KDVPIAVLTRSGLMSLNAARPVSTVVPQTTVKSPRPVKHVVNKAHSPIRRPINHRSSTKNSNFNQKVTAVKVNKGNPQQALNVKGVIDNGCSRHMTGNISFLSDFKEFNREYVAFGGNPKGGLESIEARLVVYQQNENVFEEDIKLLKLNVMLRDNALVELRKIFEKAKKERDDLKLTLEKFQTSSKNLKKLLESQATDKTGLEYDSQVFNCEELHRYESDDSVPSSLMNDRYKSGEGLHAVPPPYTGTFMPSNLIWSFMMPLMLVR